jgi:hypothetical protein
MITNPYLELPQVESSKSRSWGRGFLFGFEGPSASVSPGSDFQVEDLDAFNEGTLVGQDAAIHGLLFADDTCIDLNREGPPEYPELAWAGLDLLSVVREIPQVATKLGGMVFGLVTTFIDLSIALQTHYDDPNTALSEYGSRLQQTMSEMNSGTSVEFFVGAAVDLSQRGCELKSTGVFRNQEYAMQAARDLGRPGPKFVIRWRSDQSGGATVVQNEGE